MKYTDIVNQAKAGRPDLAAMNAGIRNSVRLAAYCARFHHSSGQKYSVRSLVYLARHIARAERWREE